MMEKKDQDANMTRSKTPGPQSGPAEASVAEGNQPPRKLLQPLADLEKWWEKEDPWNYETNPDDLNRRAMLLYALPPKPYQKTLDGFLTARLPGAEVIGVDVAKNALAQARAKYPDRISFHQGSLFDLPRMGWKDEFDLVVITGVLYPQYIARSGRLVYVIIDQLLQPGGILACCHIEEWYELRFPYLTLLREYYPYREYVHLLEVYQK